MFQRRQKIASLVSNYILSTFHVCLCMLFLERRREERGLHLWWLSMSDIAEMLCFSSVSHLRPLSCLLFDSRILDLLTKFHSFSLDFQLSKAEHLGSQPCLQFPESGNIIVAGIVSADHTCLLFLFFLPWFQMWCWNFSRKTRTGYYPTPLTQWARTDHCVRSIGPTQLWQTTSQELTQCTERTTVDAQQALPDCHCIPVHEASGAQCHISLTSNRICSPYLY